MVKANSNGDEKLRPMKEIVFCALRKLRNNTGWTTKTITKFIKMQYEIADPNLGRKVGRALRSGMKSGMVQSHRNKYRLKRLSGLMKHVTERRGRGSRSRTRNERRYRARERPLRIRSRSSSYCSCRSR